MQAHNIKNDVKCNSLFGEILRWSTTIISLGRALSVISDFTVPQLVEIH
jgi:hypothetical protein